MVHRSMQRAIRLLACAAFAATAGGSVPAFVRFDPAQETERPPEDTPLMAEMEKLDSAVVILKRSLRDAARDPESLEQIVVAQQACLAAKQMTPRMAAGVAEPERSAFVAGYRKGMAAVLAELATMEVKLLEGDRDGARASWKKLEQMEEDGHNEFTDGG